MKRKNIKRNALVTSILSLLLCVSMLVGTTFAWFTDEVTSGVNTIAAGNLDIELLANNEPVTENTKLFTVGENQLWEPGVVVYENLEIKNVGSLALKYQLTLTPYAENATTAGNKLSEVVKIAVIDEIEKGATRADILAAAKASEKVGTLADFFVSGTLNAGDTTGVAGVVVFWEPNDNEIDNLYNLKNGLKTTDGEPLFIEFSVKLFATQQMKEEDSFGSDYDKLVWANALQVRTVQDLMDAIAAGETTVMLMGNLNLEAPLEIAEGTELALNLNGKKISGATDKNTGALLVNKGKLTLVGGTVENTAVTGAAAIENQGELTLSGTQVVGAPMGDSSYPEYAVRTSGKLTVEAGTKVTSDRGAIRTDAGAEVVINGGEFIVSDKADGRNMTIHTVYAYGSGSSVTINGGRFEQNHSSTGGASVICPAGAAVTVNGGTFYDPMGDESWQNTANFQNYMGYSAPVVVKGGTFSDKSVNKWVAAGYNVVTENGKYMVVKGTPTSTVEGLTNALNNGGDVYLTAGEYKMPSTGATTELTISGSKDTVLDMTQGAYLDGAKVTIEGVTIKTGTGMANGNGSDYAALYSKDVTYIDCTFVGPMRLGRDGAKFVGCTFTELGNDYIWTNGNAATFENCTFNTAGKALLIYADGGSKVAPVVVKNCTFNATAGAKAGAIANQNCAAIEIHNYGCGVVLTTEGNTIGENFSGEWRIKTFENRPAHTITINGEAYTTIAIDGKLMTIDADRNVTVQ